jgi:excisionase family DNA binding protein
MNSGFLSYQETATVLGIPVGTVYYLVHEKKIPHKRFGSRLVRFCAKELDDWIAANSVNANNESSKVAVIKKRK